jgi:hypothetical protein
VVVSVVVYRPTIVKSYAEELEKELIAVQERIKELGS